VIANDQANAAGDGEVPPARELDHARARGQVLPLLTAEGGRRQRVAGSSTRA
jgi:hypothetical protein